MNYSFEKVIHGITKYIDHNLYSNMNELQELVARIAVGRAIERSDAMKEALVKNGIVRTFGIIDSEGAVDVDGLAHDIKKHIMQHGTLEISIPMFGRLKFVPEDVDELYRFITEA